MRDWLEARLAESPEPLRERLVAALRDAPTDQITPEALVETACHVLDGARGRLREREAAFDLLVADGLLTLACEAATEHEIDALTERCRAMGPDGRVGDLARRWSEAD